MIINGLLRLVREKMAMGAPTARDPARGRRDGRLRRRHGRPRALVPAAGTAATLVVRVEPVGGEKNTDNNQGTYTVLFAN